MIIKIQDNAPIKAGSRSTSLLALGGVLMSFTTSFFYVDAQAETTTHIAPTTAQIDVSSTTKTTIYKWQDAQGNTHYSETPPDNAANTENQTDISERIERYSGLAAVNNKGSSTLDETQAQGLNANVSDHYPNAASYCEKQRNSLTVLQNNQFVKWKSNDQDIILEGEAKAAKTAALQKEIKQYCQ